MDEQASLCSASGFSMLYRREKDFAMKDQNRIEEQASFTEMCMNRSSPYLPLLFQDVVLWLIETEQIKAFRPRRN